MTSATIATEKGDIEIDLFTTDAPKASQNFIDLANKGFYDDVVFHRVISGFVIQAGDGEFGKKSSLNRGRVGTGGPGYKFEDEPFKGDYVRGALAMANAGPNTNGSQFFICHARPDREAAEELHAVRAGDEGPRCRRRDRRGRRPREPLRPGRDDEGDDPRGLTRGRPAERGCRQR